MQRRPAKTLLPNQKRSSPGTTKWEAAARRRGTANEGGKKESFRDRRQMRDRGDMPYASNRRSALRTPECTKEKGKHARGRARRRAARHCLELGDPTRRGEREEEENLYKKQKTKLFLSDRPEYTSPMREKSNREGKIKSWPGQRTQRTGMGVSVVHLFEEKKMT